MAASLVLAACSGPSSGTEPTDPAAASEDSGSTAASAYPISIDNCGTKVTVDSPPQRIVTIKSTSTDMVAALGLADKIVGASFLDGPLPDDQKDVPILAEKLPSHESVLAQEPDFIYAGWESNFSADGAGTRSQLSHLGIATYVSPAACQESEYQPDPLTFDNIFAEITEAGKLLGASERAEQIVASQRKDLAGLKPAKKKRTALWYSSGSDIPYVGGGIGAPQLIMSAAGLDNIMATSDKTWESASWEAIAEENPQVIVLVDSTWNSAEHKIDVLESNPVTSKMDAVVNHQYVRIPFASSEAGVRTVPEVADVIDQLADLDGPASS